MLNARKSGRVRFFLFVAVIAIGVLATFHYVLASKASSEVRHVRWLISHQPTDVFTRAAAVFAQELSERTEGRLTLDVVNPQELGYSDTGDIPNADVLEYLANARVELATTYTVGLGQDDPALWSLNLPFRFSDYVSAGQILDGATGMKLLDTVESTTDTHALAFTMSGGFRIIASKSPIKTSADLKGKRIATSGGPVAQATLSALGAIPVPTDLESAARDIDENSIDAVETTYSRLSAVLGSDNSYTENIAETYHSLFLTVILASDSFYASLSAADQKALREAALVAAKVEREDSASLGEQTKAALTANGTVVSIFTAPDKQMMQDATRKVYTEFESTYGAQFSK
ncbi:MAG: 2,3-diketo-L-gulonate-binding periplasmic protein YiaO [Nitrosomonadaceae bacterium]|nr:2,3-diketo-L-gulonate-binding periplasmic protein YiaO [Nitrosomonadaceae bacterium]